MTQWRWIALAASLVLAAGCSDGGDGTSQETGPEPESKTAEQTEPAEQAEQVGQTEQAAAEETEAEEQAPATKPGWGESSPDAAALIGSALTGDHRENDNAARDEYRNPLETLQFFGLEPDMTVIELYPGGGWYTEILAPTLRKQGKLIVAGFSEDSDVEYYRRSAKAFNEKLAASPAIYGKVEKRVFMPGDQMDLGEAERADMVLTFRNLHNWHGAGVLDGVFQEAFRVLKPGGVFGVVEHRAPEGVTIDEVEESGYMPEDYVIGLAKETGFELAEKSEINANPADTGDHPAGVWTLPPTLRHCQQMEDDAEKSECERKYREIGESDRMTLKFVKPAAE